MNFLSSLKHEELELLRGIVRKTHLAYVQAKFGPNHPGVSNRECDKLIENIGPEVAERMIKFGVDRGLR